MSHIQLLALSGSLRKTSYNTYALEALKEIAEPYGVDITLGRIDQLPLFNPDREGDNIPPLNTLKAQLASAAGLIIASPEYAHGISGPLKNALDWLVSGDEFPYKPVMLINTSPRAHHALDALKEVLTTMSGRIIDDATVSIPLLGSDLDKAGILQHRDLSNALAAGLKVFCSELQ